jgi:hypothetical protein
VALLRPRGGADLKESCPRRRTEKCLTFHVRIRRHLAAPRRIRRPYALRRLLLRARRSRRPPSASIRAVGRLRLLGHDGGQSAAVCGFRQSPTSWSMQRAATGCATRSLPMPRSNHRLKLLKLGVRVGPSAPCSFRHRGRPPEPGRVPRQSRTTPMLSSILQQRVLIRSLSFKNASNHRLQRVATNLVRHGRVTATTFLAQFDCKKLCRMRHSYFYAARETTPHRVAFRPPALHVASAPCGIVSCSPVF